MMGRFHDLVVFRSGGVVTWQLGHRLTLFDVLTDFIVEGRTTEILGRYPNVTSHEQHVAITMAQRAAHKHEEQDQ